ncbi:DUF2541 family protein [Salmonella enterica subsp. enterica]|nr:DUF2541 family protein [Salmonella enterica subsp. enterica]
MKRIQLTADHGDIELSGASVYFKIRSASCKARERPFLTAHRSGWINIIAITTTNAAYQRYHSFSGHTVVKFLPGYGETLKSLSDD